MPERLSPNLGFPLELGLDKHLEGFADDTEILCTSGLFFKH